MLQRAYHNDSDSNEVRKWREAVVKELNPPVLPWVPVYSASGAMTFTSVTTTGYYIDWGRVVEIFIDLTGTTGGVADLEIRFTVPIIGVAWITSLNCLAKNGAGTAEAGSCIVVGSTATVYRTTVTAWGLGAGRGAIISGRYLKG